jgi:predicted AlkP superfamily pyrophosphatase or phosphodiesterase
MVSKVILLVIDGLRDDTAAAQMGYLEHLVEHRIADRYTVIAEMPTVSRPLYETIQTGLPPYAHGVVNNRIVRRSTVPNVFEIARQNGRVTAAAAYWWVAELYNAVPYDPIEHREVDDENLTIQHGRFYMEDGFPDSELFAQAEMLMRHFSPDYILIHPMGMDNVGHLHGADAAAYSNHAAFLDQMLSAMIPGWLDQQYNIVITSDHGMNNNHGHNGSTPDVRNVPLYLMRPNIQAREKKSTPISQLCLAPTLLRLLELPIPETMKHPPLV